MNRRQLIISAIGLLILPAIFSAVLGGGQTSTGGGEKGGEGRFEVALSEAEWKARLTPLQFSILRKHDTEFAGTSPLLDEHRKGTYRCAGCGQPLFSSDSKYESGTGWPSFSEAMHGAIGSYVDRRFLMVRTEFHCSRCGGHLGHVFPDGPPPTGLRYCTNGAAMEFVPSGPGK